MFPMSVDVYNLFSHTSSMLNFFLWVATAVKRVDILNICGKKNFSLLNNTLKWPRFPKDYKHVLIFRVTLSSFLRENNLVLIINSNVYCRLVVKMIVHNKKFSLITGRGDGWVQLRLEGHGPQLGTRQRRCCRFR